MDNLKELIKSNSKYSTGLLVSDKFVDGCGILQLHPDEISPVVSGFDYIILNLNDIMFEYKIDDIVFAKHNDFTYNGRIVAVIIKKDETSTNNIIDYMIDYQGRTVTVNEVNVYLEKH